ncbi:MAG: isoprenylcysteine carboxylmethyltransferase family protein [Clostridia bacterium]|nr:isoprenylcysteine carboxylmethyltransferase family protein [Clostridia bacterium]
MTTKLFFQAMAKYLLGVALLGALLFVPAGTLHYWQAWLFLGLLFVPMFFAGVVMMVKSPELLQKRLNAKEEEKEQKAVVALSGVMFLAAFIAAGLNARFDWLHFPLWAVWTASGVFLLAYLMYAEVMRENAYLSRTIEVQESQTVVDSGLYSIVRHPMYASTLFLFLSMGIILDSPISLAILLFYIPIIAARMKNEEKVLEEGLNGYREYKTKVKYKVIPFIW